MGCCESCLDLLEMKYFQPNYVKIPEKIIEKVEENHIETKNVLEITIPHEIELIKERTTKSKFRSQYMLGHLLGNGAFSEVKFGTSLHTGNTFAIKIIDIQQLTQGFDLQRTYTEIDILQSINHPNIIKLYEIFYEHPRLLLVLELVSGGELFDRIVAREYFTEKCARDIIREALNILCFLHGDAKIVHRDLKPENFIMISDHSDDYSMKLVDFGFASRVQDLKENEVSMGTPVYVAPEVIRGDPYGTEVDIWSFGVICYIILCGCPPFLHDDMSGLLEKILEGKCSFEEEHWKEVSIEAIDFCRKMLCVDQCDRWTSRQLLNHKWMNLSDENCGTKRHLSNSISKLKINVGRLRQMANKGMVPIRRKSISTESPTKFIRNQFNFENNNNSYTNNLNGIKLNNESRSRAITTFL